MSVKTPVIVSNKVGIGKLMLERIMGYVSIINFGMLLYLYVKDEPLGVGPFFWVAVIVICIPIIMLIDWVIVYPSVLDASYGRKNKTIQEMKRDIKLIKDKLGIEEDE